jgi:hypothetical protein
MNWVTQELTERENKIEESRSESLISMSISIMRVMPENTKSGD